MVNADVFSAAASLAAKGIPVVLVHGTSEHGCSCRNPNCPTPGKHPIASSWQTSSTTDEEALAQALDVETPRNIGVLLGPAGGIVDVEFDDAEGESTARELGLEGISTPTYQSSRSVHRLFRYDERLPQKAVVKIRGLEVRTGGGGRGAQSIVPPSRHASGSHYQWLPGFSIDDVDVAPMPSALLQAAVSAGDGRGCEKPAVSLVRGQASQGERHIAIVRFAAREAMRMHNLHSQTELSDSLAVVRAINLANCSPPLPDEEVVEAFRGAVAWAIGKREKDGDVVDADDAVSAYVDRAERVARGEKVEDPKGQATAVSMSATGLELRNDGWHPGTWQLTVQHSDPVVYVLSIPVFIPTPRLVSGGRTVEVDVELSPDDYVSARRVAQRILSQTHTLCVDSVPGEWSRAWNGSEGSDKRQAQPGLKARLLSSANHVEATAETCRYATVASYVLDALSLATPPEDGTEVPSEPDPSGMPTWMHVKGQWALVISWTRLWDLAARGRRPILDADVSRFRQQLLRLTGDTDLVTIRAADESGSRRRYTAFSAEHLRAIEQIADGKVSADGSPNPFALPGYGNHAGSINLPEIEIERGSQLTSSR